jgi:hypothetical protein
VVNRPGRWVMWVASAEGRWIDVDSGRRRRLERRARRRRGIAQRYGMTWCSAVQVLPANVRPHPRYLDGEP